MKRRDLEKHLRNHGCHLVRHGGKHDFWRNPANGAIDTVPRHDTINRFTAEGICKQLGVPRPF